MAGFPDLKAKLASFEAQRDTLLSALKRSVLLPGDVRLHLHVELQGGVPKPIVRLEPALNAVEMQPATLRALATALERINDWINGLADTP